MFAQQFGQFFKTEKRRQEVKVGAIFRNVRRGNIRITSYNVCYTKLLR